MSVLIGYFAGYGIRLGFFLIFFVTLSSYTVVTSLLYKLVTPDTQPGTLEKISRGMKVVRSIVYDCFLFLFSFILSIVLWKMILN